MKIIRPLTITEPLITASNIEPEAIPAWYSDAPPVFDLPDGRIQATSLSAAANTNAWSALAFNYADQNPVIRVFDTLSYAVVSSPALLQPTARITGIAFSTDDAYLAVTCLGSTASGLRALYVFDTSDWSLAYSQVGDGWLSADWTADYLVISNSNETRVINTFWSVVATLPPPSGANISQLAGSGAACSDGLIAIRTANATLTIYEAVAFTVNSTITVAGASRIQGYKISDTKAAISLTTPPDVSINLRVYDISSGLVDNQVTHGTGSSLQAARDLSLIHSGFGLYDATLTEIARIGSNYASFNITSGTTTTPFPSSLSSRSYRLLDSATGDIIEGTPTNYLVGETVVFEGAIYESLADSNTDVPSIGVVLDPPTWLRIGVINPMRPFDKIVTSGATNPGGIDVTITPSEIVNAISLFDVRADSVRVTMTDPTDGLVYDSGVISTVSSSGIDNWYSWFFEPYSRQVDFSFLDLPAYPGASIRIQLPSPGGIASVAEIVMGSLYTIGDAEYGTSSGIIDYSRKDTDDFGNVDVEIRGFSKRIDYDVVIDASRTDDVIKTLSDWRSRPVVWIGGDQQQTGILAYGFYRDFDVTYSNPCKSEATITVEGLQRGET